MFNDQVFVLNSEEYLVDVERQIKENEKTIKIKQQLIEDEKDKTKALKENLDVSNKLLLETQQIVEEKQSQLKVNGSLVVSRHKL